MVVGFCVVCSSAAVVLCCVLPHTVLPSRLISSHPLVSVRVRVGVSRRSGQARCACSSGLVSCKGCNGESFTCPSLSPTHRLCLTSHGAENGRGYSRVVPQALYTRYYLLFQVLGASNLSIDHAPPPRFHLDRETRTCLCLFVSVCASLCLSS